MKKNKTLLIYGAGAIGRGYIPWVFAPVEYDYYYVETNDKLCDLMNKNKRFTTFKVVNNQYESREVPVKYCYHLNEEIAKIPEVDAIITAVGPRNILSIADNLKGTTIPVICCENDSSVAELLASVIGNHNVVFAIPDVITSNIAPPELVAKDPLSIVTEDGICYIDEKIAWLGGNCKYVNKDELRKQWLAKLYLHNTPHCIAAYIGFIISVSYLHESMQNRKSADIVTGAMYEMKGVLLNKFHLEKDFVDWYAKKELHRFRNVMLFDPITRVAREPFRKLAPEERLIGAAQLCLSCGIIPENIILGIMATFYYKNSDDPDANIKYLIESLKPQDFLKIAVQLHTGEALYQLLLHKWESNLNRLKEISQ